MKKFNDHRSAQAWYTTDTNGNPSSLISYNTTVIEIHNGWMYVNGLYSMTTRKHIGWFMKLLGLRYNIARVLWQDGLKMNLETGEVQPV